MAFVGRRKSFSALLGLQYWPMFRRKAHISSVRAILPPPGLLLYPFWSQKHVVFHCFASRKRNVFPWFRGLWSSQWWFLVPRRHVFYELFELLLVSRDDERNSPWFTGFFEAKIRPFARLNHKFWLNVSSRIALLLGLSPLPQILCFSPPETDECIG